MLSLENNVKNKKEKLLSIFAFFSPRNTKQFKICVNQVKSGGKVLWLLIVLASLAVATIFLHASIQDFTSSTVVTTIATTTASLQEVR